MKFLYDLALNHFHLIKKIWIHKTLETIFVCFMRNYFTQKIMRLVSLILIVCAILGADAKPKQNTVIDRLGNKLTTFIERTWPIQYETAVDSAAGDDSATSCSPMSLDYVSSFYRQVYSANDSYFRLNENELESLIRFQVKRIVRNDKIKEQREKYKCNRNKVNNLCIFLCCKNIYL